MGEYKYTAEDLKIMQAWPLERKVRVTQLRIMEYYERLGGGATFHIAEARTAPSFWT